MVWKSLLFQWLEHVDQILSLIAVELSVKDPARPQIIEVWFDAIARLPVSQLLWQK